MNKELVLKGGVKFMKGKKTITLSLLTALMFLLVGCSGKSVGILEVGETYIGASGTSEIIEVNDTNQWTIKDRFEDDTTYTIASVTETGEKIGDYPVFRITGEEIYGDESVFAKREGEEWIVADDEEGVYFTRIRETTRDEITKGIETAENYDLYVKEKATFKFEK